MLVAHIGTIWELTTLTRSRSVMENMPPGMLERGFEGSDSAQVGVREADFLGGGTR